MTRRHSSLRCWALRLLLPIVTVAPVGLAHAAGDAPAATTAPAPSTPAAATAPAGAGPETTSELPDQVEPKVLAQALVVEGVNQYKAENWEQALANFLAA